MVVSNELKARIMELDSSRSLKEPKLLKEAAVIFLLVLVGFILNNFINKGLAIISLSGAIFLVIIAKRKPKEIFENVEWETLFFFIGLFMMIRGIENLNIIKLIGDKLIGITTGKFDMAVLGVTWISAAFTSIIGNVANAATMSKIVAVMVPEFAKDIADPVKIKAFWWALSIGSCLGGNITILSSATNVVAVGAAAKAGCKIDFVKFFKFGGLIALETLIIGSIYLFVRYM